MKATFKVAALSLIISTTAPSWSQSTEQFETEGFENPFPVQDRPANLPDIGGIEAFTTEASGGRLNTNGEITFGGTIEPGSLDPTQAKESSDAERISIRQTTDIRKLLKDKTTEVLQELGYGLPDYETPFDRCPKDYKPDDTIYFKNQKEDRPPLNEKILSNFGLAWDDLAIYHWWLAARPTYRMSMAGCLTIQGQHGYYTMSLRIESKPKLEPEDSYEQLPMYDATKLIKAIGKAIFR